MEKNKNTSLSGVNDVFVVSGKGQSEERQLKFQPTFAFPESQKPPKNAAEPVYPQILV